MRVSFLIGFLTLAMSALGQDVTDEDMFHLKVSVESLRNSEGVLQFSLYNQDGSIPDEHFEKTFMQRTVKIVNGAATCTFEDIPKGDYAVNILHDENADGKIEKGWLLPVEGIGFSNFDTINLFNRPSFEKARFELTNHRTIKINIIYM